MLINVHNFVTIEPPSFFFCVYVTIDSWVPTSKTPSQLKRVQGSSTFVIFAQQKATACKVKINHHIMGKAKSIIFNLDFDFFTFYVP